ncbi:MAG: fused response regulator/phosphatase [Gammaproteobacteria bacterium]|nr:MAG: fused response regulator/phosphatase [Gammaproteobacteria bacterium]RKZ96304.1 MAG: fused response regulator/phosphatase [Gammaproteobacteria bacterium]
MDLQQQLAIQVLESSDYGVLILDQHHKIVFWNNWLVEKSQISSQHATMKTLAALFSNSELPALLNKALDNVLGQKLQESITLSLAFINESSSQQLTIKSIELQQQYYFLLEIRAINRSEVTNDIQELQNDFEQNLAAADHLYDRIATMSGTDLPCLQVLSKPLARFSGDLVLSAPKPSGGINIFIGDFTGHGLPAAVGALPVAEVFYGMTQKGFSISDIIEEINKKLLFILPENLFCAACLVELEQEGKMLAVWNGGLPDMLVIDQDSQIKHRVVSDHLPLGVSEMHKADLETVFVEVAAGDKVFWCSDGVSHAVNKQGDKFGQHSIDLALAKGRDLATLEQVLTEFSDGQTDDLTMVELDVAIVHQLDFSTPSTSQQSDIAASQWDAHFYFSAHTLRTLDIVPLLVNIVVQIQAPHEHRQRIYTVLAELCSNALEHGLLNLDSKLKESANGFTEYYLLRGQRLAELQDGFIKVSLSHQPESTGGRLDIEIADSGEGFDYQQHAKALAENESLCGRGEGLLRQLCSEFYYSGNGNIAHAVYLWTK